MTDNITEGPEANTLTSQTDNVVSFEDWKTKNNQTTQSFPVDQAAEVQPVTVSVTDPQERCLLLNLAGNNKLTIFGQLAISGTFIAVGDSTGRIKFAAAPGFWEYATDVTGDPDYDKRAI